MRVIGNNAKPRIRCVLFHDSSQRHLRRIRHGIRLVKHNQLEAGNGVSRTILGSTAHSEDLLGTGKRLDLLAHDVDASVV
jgi:hypothetical protein